MNQRKFKKDDIVIIQSKTSRNNGRTAKIIKYCNGEYKDIVRLVLTAGGEPFNIRESSLKKANSYDVIRNMSDSELDNIVKKYPQKKLQSIFGK